MQGTSIWLYLGLWQKNKSGFWQFFKLALYHQTWAKTAIFKAKYCMSLVKIISLIIGKVKLLKQSYHLHMQLRFTLCAEVTYLLCSNAICNGLLHRLSCYLSHYNIRKAIQHFTEKGHQSDLKFWVWKGNKILKGHYKFIKIMPSCTSFSRYCVKEKNVHKINW